MNTSSSALQTLLTTYRQAAVSEREKGTYFEDLICTYLRNEATYRDLYAKVWTYADWAKELGIDGKDVGIDLVAQTHGTAELHAIQCKFYAEDYRIQKSDIDSFFTASGKKQFTHRIIITTTNNWTEHAKNALQDQQPPVSKIDLTDLENSQIDWGKYQPNQTAVFKEKKSLRDHQKRALAATEAGLKDADRGKLIMACGTGKTFTSLKIAETLAGAGKRVLFLVPSLSLLSQTLTEWTQESETPLHSFAVCSDSDVGKKRTKEDDIVQTFSHELRYPATTEPSRLAFEMEKRHDAEHMSVVFSTYHSIEVISKAQHQFDLADFDLIICDEAHRTTGSKFDEEDESNFVKVHDAEFIRSAKRLYMTATPRIYGDAAKASAEKDNVALFSMDNAELYGEELFVISFSEAVKNGLLVDYKVIVLAVDESHVSRRLQQMLSDANNSLKVDDAAKIVGCWKALSKQGTKEDLVGDQDPMKRAVAFCQVINPTTNARTHKVSSVNIASMFQSVVEAYQEQEEFENVNRLVCEAEHVDGSMNASQKEEKLTWLKEDTSENTCRILSNVRCLSEGVDVPALDAVLFLTPRNSQVDVVQSVGRVMRNAPGKKRGYVILPVVIPAGKEAHEALNDNNTYKVVWQVLQALRSHDDRFDAMVNKLDLIGSDTSKMEVIAITDKISKKAAPKTKEKAAKNASKGKYSIGEFAAQKEEETQGELEFEIGEIERAIYAKVVQKCGNRHHWEDWANDIAKIARTHIERITSILGNSANDKERKAFDEFLAELQDDLNDSITKDEAIEMLAQHIITKPVFDALFEGYSFTTSNPVSKAMQDVLDVLNEHNLDKETDTLTRFYDSVKMRASGIADVRAKQKIIVELYDKFFSNAFPRLVQKLGIVYTPVEVVDFIIHSINDALKMEFGQTLGDKNVHIIDPFTGTGTFITRLLQSGLISKEQLAYKYKQEIHANEIVLLAYYIAAINIEQVYHSIMGGDYVPFNGICLTDTFALYEKEDLVDAILTDNSSRRKRQKKLDIRVIMGNPPYSAGQGSANDNNSNNDYPTLNESIRKTYALHSKATNKNGLYNSYIKAIRWASDRIGISGVIGFVSNGGYVEDKTADGLRKCLADEFSSIYIFHLRGNQQTSGEVSKKEGGKIFGSGSRSPIAISILVKNPHAVEQGKIHFHDIGDYLSQKEKLEKIEAFESIQGIMNVNGWQQISPDQHGDWVKQRDASANAFMVMGDKKNSETALFENYTSGIKTQRDAWCFNSSKLRLSNNMKGMINFYNSEVTRFDTAYSFLDKRQRDELVDDFVNSDSSKISWTRALKQDLAKSKKYEFDEYCIVPSVYRPYTKQWLYYNRRFNEMVYQMPQIFPDANVDNRMIVIKQRWSGVGQLALMVDEVMDLQSDGGTQCFPLFLYEANGEKQVEEAQKNFLTDFEIEVTNDKTHKYSKKDAISDAGLEYFKSAYLTSEIKKEDVFYYIYGLLHSAEYQEMYSDNLTKELPRIPRVNTYGDFLTFSVAGRDLAELHLNFEKVDMYPANIVGGSLLLNDLDYKVSKMKWDKKGKDKDYTSLVYNEKIMITGIPSEAQEYVINGKSALDWVIERQCISEHKDSGIINDANDWAIDTMNNAKYPLELFLRMITVSLETMKIVRSLPTLTIKSD